jgi:hypothetical protein
LKAGNKSKISKEAKMKLTSEKFWSIIGKISLIIGLIIGLNAIIQLLKNKQPNIKVTMSYSDFAIPDAIFSSYSKKFSKDTYPFEEFQREIKNLNSAWFFEIKNEGEEEANNLELYFTDSGYYFYKIENDEPKTGKLAGRLDFGSLKSGIRIQGIIWATTYSHYSDREKFKISYSKGTTKIRYTETAHGILAWFADDFRYGFVGSFTSFFLIFTILPAAAALIFIFVHLYLFYRKNNKNI